MEHQLLPSSGNLATLDACVVVEETCAKIYRHFASLFSDNTDIAKLWSELAEEEEQHADKFRLAVKAHGSNPGSFEGENFLIKAILAKLDSFMAKMRENPPQLREAFLTAAILEHSIEKFHLETGKRMVNEELAELLSSMAHNDRCHREIMQRIE